MSPVNRNDPPTEIEALQSLGEDGQEMGEDAALSRRRIVGAAVGTITVAASGFSLSPHLEVAQAREGALDGALDGRRGERGRGREQRRGPRDRKRQRKKKDNNGPRPGRGLLKNIQVRVLNLSADPFSFVLISDVVRIPGVVRAHNWVDETDLQDDQGWIWIDSCGCSVAGWPEGVAIQINNPAFGGVWYRVWADVGLSTSGIERNEYSWALTGPTTIAERQEVSIPWPRPWEGTWNFHLRRFDDSAAFKRFELEFRGKQPPAH
jgi:hypothetical protein